MSKKYIIHFIIITFICSCIEPEHTPMLTYDAPFPKKNKNLSLMLGDKLTIKRANDTIELEIISTKDINIIRNISNNDTLFIGKVSTY
ncbi:MAG: hypothetical protein MUC81_02160 [Bacteroidia bacterium]|nr:hypothetical protein [Bacteroidia bacterium]